MRFSFNLMGMELLSFEFAWPARGLYPVPDEIFMEDEVLELFSSEEDEE